MPFTTLPTSAYTTLDATKLIGNLPAISGASLTGISSTAPSETNFLARGGSNYEPSLADNTTITVVLPNEDYDSHNGYNTSTGTYTIPSGQAGKYFFFAKFTMTNGTDRADADVTLYNSGTYVGQGRTYISSPDNYPQAHPQVFNAIDCSVGDTIQIKIYQDLGGSYPLTNNYGCYFGGFKIS